MASSEVSWWNDQIAEHSHLIGSSSDLSHHRGMILPSNLLPGNKPVICSNTSVEIGLFLAANHVNLIALEDTWVKDLFKKLKQWIWQPHFPRQKCCRKVVLKKSESSAFYHGTAVRRKWKFVSLAGKSDLNMRTRIRQIAILEFLQWFHKIWLLLATLFYRCANKEQLCWH